MFYSKDKLGTHQTVYTDRANFWRYLRENLDIIDKILLKFFTTKLHSLICYSTHYKIDSYHELTSEQVSMGSKCEVGSACDSKHDARKIASENRKWLKKLVHEPDYRTGKNSFFKSAPHWDPLLMQVLHLLVSFTLCDYCSSWSVSFFMSQISNKQNIIWSHSSWHKHGKRIKPSLWIKPTICYIKLSTVEYVKSRLLC
jgi:hypothetical protein